MEEGVVERTDRRSSVERENKAAKQELESESESYRHSDKDRQKESEMQTARQRDRMEDHRPLPRAPRR
jgi:hypothetical protein